jgi:hypothetical protein
MVLRVIYMVFKCDGCKGIFLKYQTPYHITRQVFSSVQLCYSGVTVVLQ